MAPELPHVSHGWLVTDTLYYPGKSSKQFHVLRISTERQESANAIMGAALSVAGGGWPVLTALAMKPVTDFKSALGGKIVANDSPVPCQTTPSPIPAFIRSPVPSSSWPPPGLLTR